MKMKKFALILLIIFSTLALGAIIAYFIFSGNYRDTKSITVGFGQNACIEEDFFLPNLLNFVEARQIPAYENSELSEDNANDSQDEKNVNNSNEDVVWNMNRENFEFKNSKICFSPNSKLKPETQYYLKYQWLFQDFEIIINVKDIRVRVFQIVKIKVWQFNASRPIRRAKIFMIMRVRVSPKR